LQRWTPGSKNCHNILNLALVLDPCFDRHARHGGTADPGVPRQPRGHAIFRALQPADWVDALLACREPAVALIDSEATPGGVRRAIGTARKAMLEPAEFLSALQSLRRTLAESAAMNAPRNAEH
jgi:hypothetical protein